MTNYNDIDYELMLRKIPNIKQFEKSDDYKQFLKIAYEALLVDYGYIRQLYEKNNDCILPHDVIELIGSFRTSNYFDLSKHALFKCNVLFIENENNFKFENGLYAETLIINDPNLNYNDFIEAIYHRFDFKKYPGLQLNYYSSNNVSNFDIEQFKYDTTDNETFDKYKYCIAIYFTPKLNENDIIHSIYFTLPYMSKKGPFPIIHPLTGNIAIRNDKNYIIKKLLLFLELIDERDDLCPIFFGITGVNENHNGSAESRRIHLQLHEYIDEFI